MNTSYFDLANEEQKSDKEEAVRIVSLLYKIKILILIKSQKLKIRLSFWWNILTYSLLTHFSPKNVRRHRQVVGTTKISRTKGGTSAKSSNFCWVIIPILNRKIENNGIITHPNSIKIKSHVRIFKNFRFT